MSPEVKHHLEDLIAKAREEGAKAERERIVGLLAQSEVICNDDSGVYRCPAQCKECWEKFLERRQDGE